MNILKKCMVLVLLALIQIQYVSAQTDSISTCVSCLCAKDATPAGVMISHVHNKGEWMLSYRYMSMQSNGMQQGTGAISNDQIYNQYLMSSDQMRMGMHMLMAMYGVNKKLTLMAMAEYNTASMNMLAPEGSTHVHNGVAMSGGSHDMSSAGFGDMTITGLYSLINTRKHLFLVSGGLSIPTGSIQQTGDAESMYPHTRYPYMMQSGSGTWDVLAGVTYTYHASKFTGSSQLTSVIRTGYNSVGYKLGNEWVFNNWAAYQCFDWLSVSARIEAMHIGAIDGYDPELYVYSEPSANSVNYGGSSVLLYAGLNTYFLGNNKIGIEVGLPVYQYSNGIQPTQSYNAHIMYSIAF